MCHDLVYIIMMMKLILFTMLIGYQIIYVFIYYSSKLESFIACFLRSSIITNAGEI
jgi:hypothetical protein